MNLGSKIYSSSNIIAIAGNCYANAEGFGCGIQIRGSDNNGNVCQIVGDDMWHADQGIRTAGDGTKYDSKHFGNEGLISINFITGVITKIRA